MDKRLKTINIKLADGWKDISASNPDGPPTFIDSTFGESGILQISTAEFLSGLEPNPTFEDLINLSKNIGLKNKFGALKNENSGKCSYGIFGVAQFTSLNFPHSSVWHISDGKNFIFATFICSESPQQKQLNDVKNILTSIKRKSFLRSLFY